MMTRWATVRMRSDRIPARIGLRVGVSGCELGTLIRTLHMWRFGMNRPTLPTFVTVPEAARLTRLGRRQITEAIERGDLCPVRLKPKGWPRLEVGEVRRWLRERGGSSQETIQQDV